MVFSTRLLTVMREMMSEAFMISQKSKVKSAKEELLTV
jgi:hypothetical protein